MSKQHNIVMVSVGTLCALAMSFMTFPADAQDALPPTVEPSASPTELPLIPLNPPIIHNPTEEPTTPVSEQPAPPVITEPTTTPSAPSDGDDFPFPETSSPAPETTQPSEPTEPNQPQEPPTPETTQPSEPTEPSQPQEPPTPQNPDDGIGSGANITPAPPQTSEPTATPSPAETTTPEHNDLPTRGQEENTTPDPSQEQVIPHTEEATQQLHQYETITPELPNNTPHNELLEEATQGRTFSMQEQLNSLGTPLEPSFSAETNSTGKNVPNSSPNDRKNAQPSTAEWVKDYLNNNHKTAYTEKNAQRLGVFGTESAEHSSNTVTASSARTRGKAIIEGYTPTVLFSLFGLGGIFYVIRQFMRESTSKDL
ncbi:hypothetical protein [Rothia sp. CCM 9419]|uniref:hypothetical protein n=1 Tax=Rothia sp. CCM 9419 TaxID=3402662 RepID=UPI003AE762A3